MCALNTLYGRFVAGTWVGGGSGGMAAIALGIGMFVAGVGGGEWGGRAQAQQDFYNFTPINIPAGQPGNTIGIAGPYPSDMRVTGLKNNVAHVSVELLGLSHTFPGDVGVLLVGPGGQKCELLGRCGSGTGIVFAGLRFDDDAPGNVPTPIVGGTYRPTACFASAYSAPAPAGPYGAALNVFNGTSGNGKWSLYVQDFVGGDVGTMSGWRLSIIEAGRSTVRYFGNGMTIPAGAPATTVGPASRYPSTINVSGITGRIAGVGVRLNALTHTYPPDLDMLLAGPNGHTCVLMSDTGGLFPGVNAINIGFTHNATLSVGFPALDATTYRPTDVEPGDVMPEPAPFPPNNTNLNVFNGENPNGCWSLYVSDDNFNDWGSFTGWELQIYIEERCDADFNMDGILHVQDIFDYLNAWFAGCQ